MRLAPEIMLLGDSTLARCRWTVDRETERITTLIADHPEFAAQCQRNGWTPRALAWGHIIAGLMDVAGFDDEIGRV